MATLRKPPTSGPQFEPVPIEDVDESAEVLQVFSITAYGADYPVDALVQRLRSGDIVVPTFDGKSPNAGGIDGFQREYVWTTRKADRFIESLLLGLPVPGIFLAKDASSGILLVIDGHQRLQTLRNYFDGVRNGEEFRLTGVQNRFLDKRYQDLDPEDRRRLNDSIIHATIVRQDEPSTDQNSIYSIFERLNSGGVTLQPQEIRVALYHGEFIGLLRRLNQDASWRALFAGTSKRLKDMELILRFFALFFVQPYTSPMKEFLNSFAAQNRNLQKFSEDSLQNLFTATTEAILNGVGVNAFRPQRTINAAVVDSLMVGVAARLQSKGPIRNHAEMRRRFERLMADKDYVAATQTGTAQEANVTTRLTKARKAFTGLK